ncbi:MAG: Tex family protein [Promethearchaeota archaeon]
MTDSFTIDVKSIINNIASQLSARPSYVNNVLNLLKEGGTVPFIARYRKEMHGSMDETDIRFIKNTYERLMAIENRRITVLQSIQSQGKLTDALKRKILAAKTLNEIEDLYLPYKPKRKTLATKALEKGLGPLAEIIKQELTEGDRDEILKKFYEPEEEKEGQEGKAEGKGKEKKTAKKKKSTKGKGVDEGITKPKSAKEALDGAMDIIAEEVGNTAEFRKYVREVCFERSLIVSKVTKKYAHLAEEEKKRQEELANSQLESAAGAADAENKKADKESKETDKTKGKEEEGKESGSSEKDIKTAAKLDRTSLKELIRKQMEEKKRKEEELKKKREEELLKRQKRELKGLNVKTLDEGEELGKKITDPLTYKMYFEFSEAVKTIPPHRILAINRGEKEKILRVSYEHPTDELMTWLKQQIIKKPDSLFLEEYSKAIEYGFRRYIIKAIEREIRSEITRKAEEHAISVFARNLKALLMQPPLKGRPIIGLDPGYRTGCKVAVIDANGKFLDHDVIYPVPPKLKLKEAERIIINLVNKYKARTIAIGNGTASRETEKFIAFLAQKYPHLGIEYAIVSEAGASVYSASEIAKEEFPDLDLTVRGAISIARRLQDPLSELIKIDPKSIGVGLYQHDVNQVALRKELDAVIEDCVNSVGVILNSASYKLLEYVSGLNKRMARRIYDMRLKKPFKSREELKKVPGMGEKTYEQCVGFLKIIDGDNPLDATTIHPESYWIVEGILKYIGEDLNILRDKSRRKELEEKIKKIRPKELIKYLGKDIGMPTLKDIVLNLIRPGRDPRDDLPKPILKKDIMKIEDLKPGMVLKGTVRNVVDFGAFVDIGVKYDGLIHISEMVRNDGRGYIADPLEVLNVGDIIDVRIVSIDLKEHRIQLSMRLDEKSSGGDKEHRAPQKRTSRRGRDRFGPTGDLAADMSRFRTSANIIIKQKKKK